MINELVERAHKNSVEHGFWDKEKNFGNKNKMKLDKKTEDIVFQQKQGCCGGKK